MDIEKILAKQAKAGNHNAAVLLALHKAGRKNWNPYTEKNPNKEAK